MKKILLISLFLFCIIDTTSLYAEQVNGYYRKNGTYVNGYNRSDRNNIVTDNYSYKGNVNPYTGVVGNNYYRNEISSQYYNSNQSNDSSSYSSALSNLLKRRQQWEQENYE